MLSEVSAVRSMPTRAPRIATGLARSVWVRLALPVVFGALAACADSPNPVAPPPGPPGGTLATVEARIMGTVYDTAFRPVADASVELTDRAQTWDLTTTDAEGRFEFKQGWYTFDLTLRATKSGFVPSTDAVNIATHTCCEKRVSTAITLAPVQSVTLQPGPYTLTFDATDRACSFIPDGLRMQSFAATLSAWPYGPLNYLLNVDDGRFDTYLRNFRLGVAGEELGVAEDGWLYWQPSLFERFEVGVDPVSSTIGTNTSTLKVSASAYYCEFNTTNVRGSCSIAPAEQVVRRGFCPTPLTLSPR